MIGGRERAEEMRLELEMRAHPAQPEVAQPELADAQPGVDASHVEAVIARIKHDAQSSTATRRRFDMGLSPIRAWQRRVETLAVEGA